MGAVARGSVLTHTHTHTRKRLVASIAIATTQRTCSLPPLGPQNSRTCAALAPRVAPYTRATTSNTRDSCM